MKNTADADESIAYSAGSGVTLVNDNAISIGQNTTGMFLVVITNAILGSEAVSFYWLGSQERS